MRHEQRPRVLGVDPRLILVFELGASIDADEFRKAGLNVVDSSDDRLIVVFSDDPEMAVFRERLDALTGGPPEGQQSEPYAQFFDAINTVRSVSPADRLTSELEAAISESGTDELRLDVECWHPGYFQGAVDWAAEVRAGIESAGGRVADTLISDTAGLILLRAYIPGHRITEVAALDAIARMDVLPTPSLSTPMLHDVSIDQLPDVSVPDPQTAVVGLVDSGVASGHPLIGPAVLASDPIGTNIDEDQDEHGHGTMVASLLLHGDIEAAITRDQPLRPSCRIVSARVLDANCDFPAEDLWERDLQDAILWCADHGARVINLSIGDSRAPFSPPRQMSAAAVVDELARRLGLVIVVAAGNSRPADYLAEINDSAVNGYPKALLEDEGTGLLDPGTSLLSLTAGGLTDAAASGAFSSHETLRRAPMGSPGWPSPITRKGPGPGHAIKPELVENAGTLGFEDKTLVSNDAELGIVGARAHAGRLLNWDVGTSYAAPVVSRVAATVAARFPEFTAEMIRALVLVSAERIPFTDNLEGAESAKHEAERRLLGYGRPSMARASESSSHRALLVADGNIPINGVDIYEIPVPSSFTTSGGKRGLDISLAYSPRTRVRRLDYMASRMEFHVVKGLPLDEVAQVFAKIGDSEEASEEDVSEEDVPTVSALGSNLVKLDPANTARSRGANQLGRRTFHQRLDPSRDSPMFLVVRNINRWDDDGAEQSYALAVALWRDEGQPELHAELMAQLEAVVEVPVEIEIEP